MFQPEGLGLQIFSDRYTRYEGETWVQGCKRVADHVAAAEEDQLTWYDKFYKELVSNRFMGGGRIWYGSGRPKAQLLNCFVVPTEDSREGWGQTLKEHVIVAGTGGGLGINFSPIRPRGSVIRGTGGRTTGAVSLMRLVNSTGNELQAGGGRRMALMFCLDVTHPDIPEFLDAKLDRKELTNANISVVLNIPAEEFQAKVRSAQNMHHGTYPPSVDAHQKIEFEFGGRKTGGSMRADELFSRIVKNAHSSGEPGILNGYLANQLNNIWYAYPLISTNPCGEVWLEPYGCCDLGHLVLPRFVRQGGMDWDTLANSVHVGVRFLDDVLTVNQYPFPAIQETCEKVRRIGLGVMGLHSMLLGLGMRYSSQEGKQFIDNLFNFIKIEAYKASVELAREKGPFPAFDPKMMESGFAQSALPEEIRDVVRQHGIRNCALVTVAPTGTTGMVAGVSTGIEPLFAPLYTRRFYVPYGGERKLTSELVVTPEFQKYGELAEGAYDITPVEHFEIQKIVQFHVDNAVSKTINLPSDYPAQDLEEVWLEYLPYVKGSTLYRAGSRGEEPLEPISVRDARKYLDGEVKIESNPLDQSALSCTKGVCELPISVRTA